MRVDCDWVLYSELVIEDAESSNVSLINVIEQINAGPLLFPLKVAGFPEPYPILLRGVICASWAAEAPVSHVQRYCAQIRNSEGVVLWEQQAPLDFGGLERARSRIVMAYFPVKGDGVYTIEARCLASDQVEEQSPRRFRVRVDLGAKVEAESSKEPDDSERVEETA